MITLNRIGMVNWHLLPAMDVELDGNTGVIGENRSGKSTLLDLIQTVMTGNSGRYLRLNASANEAGRKRGRRSVHAYCLGRLGADSTLRKEARTYIYLVFRDQQAKNNVCTVGLALEARTDESSERTLARFVAPGVALSVDDVLQHTEKGDSIPMDWAVLRKQLENRCTEAGESLSVHRDNASAFVGDYLKRLTTSQHYVQPERFLKAFVNAVSFEQISDATDFVRRYILDDGTIKIGQLRDSINTYRTLQREIADLTKKLHVLHDMQTDCSRFEKASQQEQQNKWTEARARFDHAFQQNRRQRRLMARHLQTQHDAKAAQHDLRAERESLQEELQAVNTAIASHSHGQQKAELHAEQARKERDFTTVQNRIRAIYDAATAGFAVLQYQNLIPAAFTPAIAGIQKLSAATGTTQPPAWPQNAAEIAALLDHSDILPDGLREVCEMRRDDAIKQQGTKERQKQDLEDQVAAITKKGVALRRETETLMLELDQRGFNPRLVGEELRVVDENWRHAVEALLGKDREALIVDDACVEDAIRHLQKNRQRLRGCRIINTRKVDASKCIPQRDTLAAVLSANDPVIMAFVIRRIGNVRLAHSVSDLHKPGRAIMQDGTYDDGLAVEMREPIGGHKIGAQAGMANLSLLQDDLSALNTDIRNLKETAKTYKIMATALEKFAGAVGRGDELLGLVDHSQRLHGTLHQIRENIEDLARSVDPDLARRQGEIKDQIRIYESELEEEIKREAEARTRMGQVTETLNASEQSPGSTMNLRWRYRQYRQVKHRLPLAEAKAVYTTAAAKFDQHAGQRAENFFSRLADEAKKQADDAHSRKQEAEARLWENYFNGYHVAFGLKPDYTRSQHTILGDVAPWVHKTVQRIEENDLVRYEQDARDAAEKAQAIFQHSFINELRHRFQNMERALDDMNRILRPHQFHYETYRFIRKPVEQYRGIVELVDAAAEDENLLLPLFENTIDASHPHAWALKTVQELLLDETRDIEEFEDYRLYYTFDLMMKDSKTGRETNLDSRRGTGSGAEQQVPFYVAIGTALATAYHQKAAGDATASKGIGLAVFDEAFSKLDGKNQKACIDFYSKLGLQILIAAPFDKRGSFYETMDTLVETFRSGDRIDVEITRIETETKALFAQSNPANMDIEDFRTLFASQTADA